MRTSSLPCSGAIIGALALRAASGADKVRAARAARGARGAQTTRWTLHTLAPGDHVCRTPPRALPTQPPPPNPPIRK